MTDELADSHHLFSTGHAIPGRRVVNVAADSARSPGHSGVLATYTLRLEAVSLADQLVCQGVPETAVRVSPVVEVFVFPETAARSWWKRPMRPGPVRLLRFDVLVDDSYRSRAQALLTNQAHG